MIDYFIQLWGLFFQDNSDESRLEELCKEAYDHIKAQEKTIAGYQREVSKLLKRIQELEAENEVAKSILVTEGILTPFEDTTKEAESAKK